MDNFIVSARKYRPDTFDDVVGQEAITSTLKNAIKTSHLAQAYLFCGPRGVGKTTCARILAKTINCQNLSDTVQACGKCESCKAFENSRSFNIHELDAASNNKVDDIRTLTDQVKIPPQVGKYSIYIIDEVHMLSTSAFNAFLKTLEEPPAHAVFILATTEKQKIIPTILSRCQIFDFHRITLDDIVSRLQYVVDKEGHEAEPEALQIIAQKSDGSMRDGLSILDQIVSYSGKNIKYSDVIENLNVLDYEYYLKVTKHFLQGDISASLLIFDEILGKGFDGHNFITGLSSHFRNLLVCKDRQTIRLMELGSKIKERYAEQTENCSTEFLFKALEILNLCDVNYKLSKNQRLHVELALIKLSMINAVAPAQETVKKNISGLPAERENRVTNTTVQKSTIVAPEKEKAGTQGKEKNTADSSHSPEHAKSFSIKDRLKKPAENGSEPVAGENESDATVEDAEFDEDILTAAWQLFGEKVKERSPRMSSIIKAMKPEIHEGNKIVLSLSTKAQKEYFDNNYKQDLLSHLKNELKNNSISFITEIAENVRDNTPYTDEEKLKHMINKNPAIDKLKNDFRLDFE